MTALVRRGKRLLTFSIEKSSSVRAALPFRRKKGIWGGGLRVRVQGEDPSTVSFFFLLLLVILTIRPISLDCDLLDKLGVTNILSRGQKEQEFCSDMPLRLFVKSCTLGYFHNGPRSPRVSKRD